MNLFHVTFRAEQFSFYRHIYKSAINPSSTRPAFIETGVRELAFVLICPYWCDVKWSIYRGYIAFPGKGELRPMLLLTHAQPQVAPHFSVYQPAQGHDGREGRKITQGIIPSTRGRCRDRACCAAWCQGTPKALASTHQAAGDETLSHPRARAREAMHTLARESTKASSKYSQGATKTHPCQKSALFQ